MRQTCTECDRPAFGRGLCSKHYQHARYHGQLPEVPPVRICERCGREFSTRKWSARFCSRECADAAHHERRRDAALEDRGERRCLNCGQIIPDAVTLKAKCCSRECGIAWHNTQTAEAKRAAKHVAWLAAKRICQREGCGELIPESRPLYAKFCSPKCKKKDADAKWRLKAPAYNRRYKYGVSEEEFDDRLAEQGGVCGICGTSEWKGKGNCPHTDHDHVTRQFRGVLCGNCNNGIGMFGEDPARLRAAADYLEAWQARL